MSALAINYQPMTTILLYGQLRQFGRSFRLSVRTPAEAIKALCVQIPGFERFLSNAKSRGIEFAVFRGKTNIGESELGFGGDGEILIAPIITGSKKAGGLQTIIGAVLIVVGLVITGGTFGAGAPFGSSMQPTLPKAVGCQPPPAPAAWIMQPYAPDLTQRMLNELSPSPVKAIGD